MHRALGTLFFYRAWLSARLFLFFQDTWQHCPSRQPVCCGLIEHSRMRKFRAMIVQWDRALGYVRRGLRGSAHCDNLSQKYTHFDTMSITFVTMSRPFSLRRQSVTSLYILLSLEVVYKPKKESKIVYTA